MKRLAIVLTDEACRQWEAAPLTEALRRLAAEGGLTILASPETRKLVASVGAEVWPDGLPRGILRSLALMRRISWADFDEIIDFENSSRTRLYKWAIRPCPAWYSADLKPHLFDNAA